MYAPIDVDARSGSAAVSACWLPTCTTCTAKSSRITPRISRGRDHDSCPIATHEARSAAKPTVVARVACPASAQCPAPGGAERAGEPGESEESDLRLAEAPRRVRQGQGQAAPQRSEGREQEERDQATAQRRAIGEPDAELAQQRPVADRGGLPVGRESAQRQHGDQCGERGEGDVDAAPAPDVREQPGDGAGAEDADHDAGRHDADGASAL